MPKRIRVRPGKAGSFVGFAGGIILVLFGLFFAISGAGVFGIIWTLFAAAITFVNGYNAISTKGISSWNVEVEDYDGMETQRDDFENKLRKLHSLKADGLISDEEFAKKREEILNEKW